MPEPINAVYIHIPFCLKKCHYCDFLSFAQPEQMEQYVSALLVEMQLAVQRYAVQAKTILSAAAHRPACRSRCWSRYYRRCSGIL